MNETASMFAFEERYPAAHAKIEAAQKLTKAEAKKKDEDHAVKLPINVPIKIGFQLPDLPYHKDNLEHTDKVPH